VLIEGLLKQKRIMVLGAASKIGKTWTLVNLAISIASGQPWLGCNTTKGKVLYLNFELPSTTRFTHLAPPRFKPHRDGRKRFVPKWPR
jgi:RecA-family ATPase